MRCNIQCCLHNHLERCTARRGKQLMLPLKSASCRLAFTQRAGCNCSGCACNTDDVPREHAVAV
jgi:hypothetical protein